MKKPEKKTSAYQHQITQCKCNQCYEAYIYNQTIDKYEKFLPSEEEILKILIKNYKRKHPNGRDVNKETFKGLELIMEEYFLPDLAEAIAKRIGK